MKYILDTNIISYWMRGDLDIISRLSKEQPEDISVSTVTCAEIFYGIEKSPKKKIERRKKIDMILSLVKIFSMDIDAALHYSRIRVYLEKSGIPISERDLQIASIARSRGLCLVTHNVEEFTRVPDLVSVDWYKN
jgi:tRNA(fMet)-specific endonuclease VapC